MTKIKLICYSVIAAIICILFVLWRVSASNYKIEKTNKELLETQLKASQIAIENLKEYNKKIAEEMGKIEKEYNERFKNNSYNIWCRQNRYCIGYFSSNGKV